MVTMAVAMSMFSAVVTPGMEMVSALQTVLMSVSMSVSTISMLMFLVSKSLLVRKLVLLHHRFGIHTIMVGVVMMVMMMLMLISVFVMHKVVATMFGHEGNNDGEKNEFHAASLATTAIAAAFLVAGGSNSGGA